MRTSYRHLLAETKGRTYGKCHLPFSVPNLPFILETLAPEWTCGVGIVTLRGSKLERRYAWVSPVAGERSAARSEKLAATDASDKRIAISDHVLERQRAFRQLRFKRSRLGHSCLRRYDRLSIGSCPSANQNDSGNRRSSRSSTYALVIYHRCRW